MKEDTFCCFPLRVSVSAVGEHEFVLAETIKIAVSVGLSGPNAIYAKGSSMRSRPPPTCQRAGGVLGGKKMEIFPMDNKGTPRKR